MSRAAKRTPMPKGVRIALPIFALLLVGSAAFVAFEASRTPPVWPEEMPPPFELGASAEHANADCEKALRDVEALPEQLREKVHTILSAKGMPDQEQIAGFSSAPEVDQSLDRLVSCKGLWLPPGDLLDTDPPRFLPLIDATRARLARGWWNASRGRMGLAAQDMATAVRISGTMEHSGANQELVLFGILTQSHALKEAAELASQPGIGHQELATLRDSIAPFLGRRPGAVTAIIGDCISNENVIKSEDATSPAATLSSWDRQLTIAAFRVHCHKRIAAAKQPPSQRTKVDPTELAPSITAPVRFLDNPTGRALLDALTLHMDDHTLSHSDYLQTIRGLLLARLALAEHALDHEGALPPSLESLVPRYLAKVPHDAISEEPIAYDPNKRALWSRGAEQLPAEIFGDDNSLPHFAL